MDETTEELVDVHEFVDEFIKRDYNQTVTQSMELIIGEDDEFWFEVSDQDYGECKNEQYYCTHCGKNIGDEEDDVMEHIRSRHKDVTGLPKKKVAEDNTDFEDE